MGLASARTLILKHPGLSIGVVEKEKDLGMYVYRQLAGNLLPLMAESVMKNVDGSVSFWVLLKGKSGTRACMEVVDLGGCMGVAGRRGGGETKDRTRAPSKCAAGA